MIFDSARVHQSVATDRYMGTDTRTINAIGDMHCCGVTKPALGADADVFTVSAQSSEFAEITAVTLDAICGSKSR
jgi:hypothetical protein